MIFFSRLFFIGGTLISLLTLAVYLFIKVTLLVVTIRHQSMAPTLKDGDRVLAVRFWPKAWLRRESILLVIPGNRNSSALSYFGKKLYIKRLVGLPGETIAMNLAGTLEVVPKEMVEIHNAQIQQHWHIPQKHFFVCGDSYVRSIDSRVWGPLPFECISGVVIMKLRRNTKISSKNH